MEYWVARDNDDKGLLYFYSEEPVINDKGVFKTAQVCTCAKLFSLDFPDLKPGEKRKVKLMEVI